jgi:hypothetical protein
MMNDEFMELIRKHAKVTGGLDNYTLSTNIGVLDEERIGVYAIHNTNKELNSYTFSPRDVLESMSLSEFAALMLGVLLGDISAKFLSGATKGVVI